MELWAAGEGLDGSEALRKLLNVGLDHAAEGTEIALRPPRKWMVSPRGKRHVCTTGGTSLNCGGGMCFMAWKHFPQEWFLAQVTPGRDWWNLDEVLRVAAYGTSKIPIPPVQRGHFDWFPVPMSRLDTVRAAFTGHPSRLVMHSLVEVTS